MYTCTLIPSSVPLLPFMGYIFLFSSSFLTSVFNCFLFNEYIISISLLFESFDKQFSCGMTSNVIRALLSLPPYVEVCAVKLWENVAHIPGILSAFSLFITVFSQIVRIEIFSVPDFQTPSHSYKLTNSKNSFFKSWANKKLSILLQGYE